MSTPSTPCSIILALFSISIIASTCLGALPETRSRDGYVRRTTAGWVIGTASVEKVVHMEGGKLLLASHKNKASDREYFQGGRNAGEFRLIVGSETLSGSSGGWSLVREETHRLAQGELELAITLRRAPVEVVKHYVVYPGTPVIREWLEVANASHASIRIREPYFLDAHVMGEETDSLEFLYITGGGSYNGSQLLKQEKMSRTYQRTLDAHGGIEPYEAGCYNSYLPLVSMRNITRKDGLAAGWDYLGHWIVQAGNFGAGPGELSMKLGGYTKELAPGERITTPKAFTAAFAGDLDAMGNTILDWQYEYMWEYTNPDYFAKTRWSVDWPMPYAPAGGVPNGDNWGRRFALDIRYIDLMRATGGDILWDDAGWYDKWGSWRGPDWSLVTDYLNKYGMKWKLWFPTFLGTRDSIVGQKHPDWVIPGQFNLDQSIRGTIDWQYDLLKEAVAKWGDFQYRYDGGPAVATNDTDQLAADQNFRELLERFRRDFKGSGVDSCHGGGRWISYDIARLSDSGEYSDGGIGPYTGYYTSLLMPPDKLHNNADFDHTYYNAGSDRTHLAASPMWYRDPGDGPSVEAIRKDWDLYRYLLHEGVAGRWSHVFRPDVENDDAIWYFQRADRTSSKSMIITKHPKTGPVYYLLSQPLDVKPSWNKLGQYAPISGGGSDSDGFYGAPWNMPALATTSVAAIDTGIYQDPTDGGIRYYGVTGEAFGPMNFKYEAAGGELSFVTAINKAGGRRKVNERSFGMAIQSGQAPVTITKIGQFQDGKNIGRYKLTLIRASDGALLGSTELDMANAPVDSLGFAYASLPRPVRLDNTGPAVTIKPRGLQPGMTYDVHCAVADCRARRTGADLMQNGMRFNAVLPGELVFLNLPLRPESGGDKTPPTVPKNVTKRIASNLGMQGIEIAWLPGTDNNWISYYAIVKNGVLLGKAAKGTFYFDHKGAARQDLNSPYKVCTVDGDGNRSECVAASEVAGEPETYRPLGEFGPAQSASQWRYEESADEGSFREMSWDPGGYEGRWTGSGAARIGRIWMQPSASTDVSRTFLVPADAVLTIAGEVRKDPSADNQRALAARIVLNDRVIWPTSGWAEISSRYDNPIHHQLANIASKAGDRIRFIIRRTGTNEPDPVIWDPIITVRNQH